MSSRSVIIFFSREQVEYWPSHSWKALVSSSRNPAFAVDLELPFALIGSHPVCTIRINKRRVPKLAYIAFSFGDSIEAWPLSALAFSQWGLFSEDQKLRVGRTSIQLFQDNEIRGNEASDATLRGPQVRFPETTSILQIDYRGQKGSFVLDRRVIILGNEHPSTRRLHGVGLARCAHAVVSVGKKCWLVNLQPGINQSIRDLVKAVPPNGDEIRIGRISISSRLPSEKELSRFRDSSAKDLPLSSDMRIFDRNQKQWVVGQPDPVPVTKTGLEQDAIQVSRIDTPTNSVNHPNTRDSTMQPVGEPDPILKNEFASGIGSESVQDHSPPLGQAAETHSIHANKPFAIDEPIDPPELEPKAGRAPMAIRELNAEPGEKSEPSEKPEHKPDHKLNRETKLEPERKVKSQRWSIVKPADDPHGAVSKRDESESGPQAESTDLTESIQTDEPTDKTNPAPVADENVPSEHDGSDKSTHEFAAADQEASNDVGHPQTASDHNEVENVASDVTDRLVSMGRSKWLKKPIVKFSLIATFLLVTVSIVVLILTTYVLPFFQN